MKNFNLVDFVKDKKHYDHVSAVRAAYQTKLFVKSMIYMFLIALIMYVFGLLPECLILFVAFKLFRENAGGIHVHGYIRCFILSLSFIGLAILLTKLIPVTGIIELLLLIYTFIIWSLYVPQGTSQRPIRKDTEKKRMKWKFFLLILITLMLRFINLQIYFLVMWAMVLVLSFTTPIAYSLLHVKHDRIPEN